MAHFFQSNGVPAIHHTLRTGHRGHQPALRDVMKNNVAAGRPLLFNLSDEFMFYSDYGTGRKRPWYELIVEQYPSSKFLLQIRPIHKWLRSRYKHRGPDGFYIDRAREQKQHQTVGNETVLDQEIRILWGWQRSWYSWICRLISYFKERQLTDNLLIFDIERDSPRRIVSFFGAFGLTLDVDLYGHAGNTESKHGEEMELQTRKWEDIVAKVPEFGDFRDNLEGEMTRIWSECAKNLTIDEDGLWEKDLLSISI